MLRTLGRIIVVAVGFVMAIVTATIILLTLGMERLTYMASDNRVPGDSLEGAVELARSGIDLLTAASVLPALLVIIVGEIARIRASLYYILGGGAAMASIPLIAQFGDTGSAAIPALMVWQVFATAGFAGGFVYWLLAGRRA